MNDHTELVSAVIITYKRPLEILSRAVMSVLCQTYENLELTVVNDAPEDVLLSESIREYIESLNDQRIHYIIHPENMGANAARNTGLSHSKGKYIAFLDDDDEWLPEKIEKQIEAFHNHEHVGMVYCGFLIRSEKWEIEKKANIYHGDDLIKKLVEDNFIGSTSYPLILREALDKVGGFDSTQKSCQEYELWLRLANEYTVVGVVQPLGVYYVSKDSTFKGNMEKYIAGDNAIIKKHSDLFKRYPVAYSNHFLHMATSLSKEKQYFKAFMYKLRAWGACWYNPMNLTLVYLTNRAINKKSRCYNVN